VIEQTGQHQPQYGFLQKRPINPLLACPQNFGERRAGRTARDLNYIWENQRIDYRFSHFLYRDVEDIRKEIEREGYDALMAVLPEGSRAPQSSNDTYELIKKRIEVPSLLGRLILRVVL
jgi:hypothetical protein